MKSKPITRQPAAREASASVHPRSGETLWTPSGSRLQGERFVSPVAKVHTVNCPLHPTRET